MGTAQRHPVHTFDIDKYLNPITPRPRLYLLPRWISFWFGYREPPKEAPSSPKPGPTVLLVWLFSFTGAFIGISIIENVFLNLPQLGGHPAPTVIASFGAAAILEYNAIESPLSQPRNLILGHFLSALIGVSITKLFYLLPQPRFEDLRWLAGALAVGCASSVMSITKTIHPPAGATALLAATTPEITELGWWLLPLVLLASMLMLVSAMLVNNLYKRFPLYWWTPVDLGKLKEDKKAADPIVSSKDVEKGNPIPEDSGSSIASASDAGLRKNAQPQPERLSLEPQQSNTSQQSGKASNTAMEPKRPDNMCIDVDKIVVPEWLSLSEWEQEVLEGFQIRLKERSRRSM